jgi:hypothetical protein
MYSFKIEGHEKIKIGLNYEQHPGSPLRGAGGALKYKKNENIKSIQGYLPAR